MKLLVYYNTRSGRYYLKFKAIMIDSLSRITSQGHILVCAFDLEPKTRITFCYRLGLFLERLARFLKRNNSGLKRFIRFK